MTGIGIFLIGVSVGAAIVGLAAAFELAAVRRDRAR